MESNLTDRELDFIKQLLKNDENRKQERTILVRILPILNALLGTALIFSSIVLFLNNPVINVAKWVLLPGIVSGIILLVTGLLLSRENARALERKKMAAILRKLVDADLLIK